MPIDKKADIDDFYVEGVSYVRTVCALGRLLCCEGNSKMLAQALKEYPKQSITRPLQAVLSLYVLSAKYADYSAIPKI